MIDIKPIQKILSYARRAVDDYEMISEGDRIAVGVSGGKDSLALLCSLNELKRFYPKKFEVVPITLGLGFADASIDNVTEVCNVLGLELNYIQTEIFKIVFEIRQEKNPCSLCANLRRGALNDAALKLGCKKLALGHHFDDVVETFYMNLFNEGRIGCFSPVTLLDRRDITIIRPMIYVPEKEIKHFIRESGITPSPKYCPADGETDREKTKNLLAELSKTDKGIKQRLFGAIERAGVSGFKVCPRAKRTKTERLKELKL